MASGPLSPPWAWRTTEKARSDRVKQGKKNKECIDQKLFKTEEKYIFDSIVLDKVCISILDGYIKYIRPFLHPDSDYLLVNRNGKQLSKLADCLSILVFKVQMKCVFLIVEFERAVKNQEDRRLPFLNISSSSKVITV